MRIALVSWVYVTIFAGLAFVEFNGRCLTVFFNLWYYKKHGYKNEHQRTTKQVVHRF